MRRSARRLNHVTHVSAADERATPRFQETLTGFPRTGSTSHSSAPNSANHATRRVCERTPTRGAVSAAQGEVWRGATDLAAVGIPHVLTIATTPPRAGDFPSHIAILQPHSRPQPTSAPSSSHPPNFNRIAKATRPPHGPAGQLAYPLASCYWHATTFVSYMLLRRRERRQSAFSTTFTHTTRRETKLGWGRRAEGRRACVCIAGRCEGCVELLGPRHIPRLLNCPSPQQRQPTHTHRERVRYTGIHSGVYLVPCHGEDMVRDGTRSRRQLRSFTRPCPRAGRSPQASCRGGRCAHPSSGTFRPAERRPGRAS
jgi:hypothetical protein